MPLWLSPAALRVHPGKQQIGLSMGSIQRLSIMKKQYTYKTCVVEMAQASTFAARLAWS